VANATWQTVVAGGSHTVGLRDDGTLWTWGENSEGQLGNGMSSDANAPQAILSRWGFDELEETPCFADGIDHDTPS
jgi:alpha-tubulin suppressor-like RCC1 family protein